MSNSIDNWGGWHSVILAATSSDSNDVWEGWGSVILVAGATLMIIVVIGVIAWQAFKTWQARIATAAEVARDAEYRKLADQAITTQQKFTEELHRLGEELTEMRARVSNMERLLREVE